MTTTFSTRRFFLLLLIKIESIEQSRSIMKNDEKTRQTVCQRFSTRNLPCQTNESTRILFTSYQQRKRNQTIQETNLNENYTSDCPLTEDSFKERIDQYLFEKKYRLSTTHTEKNLHKLQQITDDVKLLTRQLQLSIESNRNENAQSTDLDERLLGEICYQLERRILILIYSQSKHLYGYSLRLLPFLLDNEINSNDRRRYQRRWNQIETYLRQCHFHLSSHSILTFETINRFGIYSDFNWLNDHIDQLSNVNQLKILCHSMLKNSDEKKDFSILIDSLQLISKSDGHPLFYW